MRKPHHALGASAALVLTLGMATPLLAADPIRTPAGPFELVDNGFYDTSLRLGGVEILRDEENMSVDVVSATADNGILVLGLTPGGSGCAALYRILDTRSGKPVLSDSFGTCSDLPEISMAEGMVIVAFPGDEISGRPVWGWNGTALREGRIQPKTQPAAPAKALLKSVGEHPADLLDDPGVAQRLRAHWGDAAAEVSDRLGVASGTRLVDDRYIVGHGCMPHACSVDEAFIAVDVEHGEVYAMIMRGDGSYQMHPRAGTWPDAVHAATREWQPDAPDILDAAMESDADVQEYETHMKAGGSLPR